MTVTFLHRTTTTLLRCHPSARRALTTNRPLPLPRLPSRRFHLSPACNLSSPSDTIFALSTGAATSAVAIIRLSGPHATPTLSTLLRPPAGLPPPRLAALRALHHPHTGELLDRALVLRFCAPASFTGEDVVELHVHGSRAVVAGLVDALSSVVFEGGMVRAAERGEFTRRAFEAGRLDLTEVEGLADLIAAETAMQRRQALRIMGGHVAELLEGWRTEIKTCLAHVEAVIDFGDDVDDDAFEAIVPRVAKLSQRLQSYLYDGHRGEIVRGGARVVIVGEPNAGKSTLLNAFAKRPAAIVSPLAGTTRDVVEVQMDFNGLPVIVSDTAGLRDATDDPIEIEGMRRARNAASIADITILVHDATKGTLDYALKALPSRLNNNSSNAMQRGSTGDSLICVLNKIDLQPSVQSQSTDPNIAIFKTCLLRNEGMAELTTYLENVLRKRLEGQTGEQCGGKSDHDLPIITRARHRHHMAKAVEALECFVEGRTGTDRSIFLPMDMAAENLRIAGKELGAITGIIHVEEVLDVIFSEFCIGK